MNIKKKIKFPYIMFIVFLALMTIFFTLGIIASKNISNSAHNDLDLKLSNVAGYLKLLSENKTQSIFNIAMHNFGLAITAYILSFLSSGFLGIIPLCSSFFIGGVTFYTLLKNTSNIFFLCFELLGMFLAVSAGMIFREKQKTMCWSIKKVIILSIALIIGLFLIYIIASCVENELIQSLWS